MEQNDFKLNFLINNTDTNHKSLLIEDAFSFPKYTILIGKNNSGKSWLLRELTKKIEPRLINSQDYKKVFDLRARYVSPERFGDFKRSSGYEEISFSQRTERDFNKLKNQSADFFEDAISSFNALINILRRPSKDGDLKEEELVNSIIYHLNDKISDLNFSVAKKEDNSDALNFLVNSLPEIPNNLSSGTMQFISLIMYVLDFLYSGKYSEDAYLIIDEPDVHIHPDLQVNFIEFLINLFKETKHKIIIATHSSSIISGFRNQEEVFIALLKDKKELRFQELNEIVLDLLPSIGAHSLTYIFNKSPLLLIEGVDDYIVWNNAIRKSKGKINFHLVEVEGTPNFPEYEKIISDISPCLFDKPKVYEIRDADLDEKGELKKELSNIDFIQRSYLNCREIENLIFSNEVLESLGISSWEEASLKLKDAGIVIDRYKYKIEKEYDILKILNQVNTSKSWEHLVGEALGRNIENISTLKNTEGSIFYMLGEKISSWLENN